MKLLTSIFAFVIVAGLLNNCLGLSHQNKQLALISNGQAANEQLRDQLMQALLEYIRPSPSAHLDLDDLWFYKSGGLCAKVIDHADIRSSFNVIVWKDVSTAKISIEDRQFQGWNDGTFRELKQKHCPAGGIDSIFSTSRGQWMSWAELKKTLSK